MFAVHKLLIFSLNVITAKRNYRSITASCLPSPRYYRDIFPVPAVITTVAAALPLSPLQCHPLNWNERTRNANRMVEMCAWTMAQRPHRKCDANAYAFASIRIDSSSAKPCSSSSYPRLATTSRHLFIGDLDFEATSRYARTNRN